MSRTREGPAMMPALALGLRAAKELGGWIVGIGGLCKMGCVCFGVGIDIVGVWLVRDGSEETA